MRATSPAPVAIVFARSAIATFPPASFSPMIPEPTTVASKKAVPSPSATARRGRSTIRSFLPQYSKYPGKITSAAAALTSLLAAVLPEVVRQDAQRRVVGGVVMERPLGARGEDPCVEQAFQVMTQRRRREVHMGLDLPGSGALGSRLNHEAEDLQPDRVAEGTELLGVTLYLRGHEVLLIFSKHRSKVMFQNSGRMRTRRLRFPRGVDSNGAARDPSGCGRGRRG